MPDKSQIIKLLNELADMLEFVGENKFKVGAYRNGANAIRKVESDIEKMISEKNLDQIKGIGSSLQAVIYEYADMGRVKQHDELKKQVPVGVTDLLKIKRLGPQKVRQLYSELAVSDLTQLEDAVKNNKLRAIKGFTESLINSIPGEITQIRKNKKFILLNKALDLARSVIMELKTLSLVSNAEMTGELRRGMEVISTLPIIMLVKNEEGFLAEIGAKYNITREDKAIIIADLFEIPVIINYYLNSSDYTKGMFLTTGSSGFINKLFNNKDLVGKTEIEIFKNAKIPYVIPEMREEEFIAEKKKKLKENSDLTLNEFKGLLHWHTTYSDGKDTLETMLDNAVSRNFQFVAVCDHSKSAAYANGLKEERIFIQKDHLNQLKEHYQIDLFHGIESDILANGTLDYPDEFLHNFDFIVASVHSRFNLDEKEMTARIIKAIENPYTDLLGHPSGRLLLSREAYKIDMPKIIDACASNSVAIEINSHPKRLDLDWRWVFYAREKGCIFSINADAHSISDIDYLKYGIMIGRKAGLKNDEVINCYDTKTFKQFLNRKVKRNIA
jgi:DNA polymerase (family X)